MVVINLRKGDKGCAKLNGVIIIRINYRINCSRSFSILVSKQKMIVRKEIMEIDIILYIELN